MELLSPCCVSVHRAVQLFTAFKRESAEFGQSLWQMFKRLFQMFYAAAYFFLAFLIVKPSEGIVGGVKAQIGQFPYIVSFLCFFAVDTV